MSTEDRLRGAITRRTTSIEPSPDALHRIEEKLMDAERATNRNRWLIGIGSVAAAAAVLVGVLALTDEDDPEVDTVDTTTSSTESTPTTEETTTTSLVPPAEVDPAVPIFPDPATSRRFDSPESAVHNFVTEVVGMSSPMVGPFQQGDSRSGEIEVRAFADQTDPTIVLVRQLEDDTWYVLGGNHASIQPAQPEAGATVTSPLALTGQAYAFEGTVAVRVHADGATDPIGTTFVTGRGDGVLGDYEGEVDVDPASAAHGFILYLSEGGEDGAPIAFVAHRLHFG
jgi:hypothetical protein